MDTLYIDQLTVMASIGIYDWEKQCLQKLVFDLQLTFEDTYFESHATVLSYLDYTQINRIILNLVNKKHFLLIEHVAETVARTLMKEFSVISWIRVKVNKPNAICNARNVGICIERSKLKNFKNYIYIQHNKKF